VERPESVQSLSAPQANLWVNIGQIEGKKLCRRLCGSHLLPNNSGGRVIDPLPGASKSKSLVSLDVYARLHSLLHVWMIVGK